MSILNMLDFEGAYLYYLLMKTDSTFREIISSEIFSFADVPLREGFIPIKERSSLPKFWKYRMTALSGLFLKEKVTNYRFVIEIHNNSARNEVT